jgi:hypothetical protein
MATGCIDCYRRASLHLAEAVEKLAGNGQTFRRALEQDELLSRILAHYARHCVDLDNCTVMHLPEAVWIEVGDKRDRQVVPPESRMCARRSRAVKD